MRRMANSTVPGNEWFESVIDWLSPLLNGLAKLKGRDESGRSCEGSPVVVATRKRRSLGVSQSRKHSALKIRHVFVKNGKSGAQNK